MSCLTPAYLPALPTEPKPNGNPYTLKMDINGRVTVCAPEALNETAIPDADSNPICVTR